jgi:hypothetical protein
MHNVEAWRRGVQGQVFLGRKVGTGHYDFMHNVEVSAKRVRGQWVKKEGGESDGEVGVIEGRVETLWLYA